MSRFKYLNPDEKLCLLPCYFCKDKKHYMQYKDCSSCQGRGGGDMQPVSENVCWGTYRCAGCEAYQDRYR